MKNKGSIAILAGGGPAPGINTVIGTIAKVFLKDGYRVIGLHGGFESLFAGKPQTVDFDYPYAEDIYKRGGSALRMSRYKPKDGEFNTSFFEKNDIRLLVTIGGDDTASTANRISKYLSEQNIEIQNLHVPKTIDNDLPLPEGQPTFGYQSAKDEGVRIAQTVYEDARTSGNWFIVSAMGREAGHLAFGIGAACHYPMIIIPEMFNKTEVSFDKIINLVISAILKRKILGLNYGVAVISEGVFHFMSEGEIKSSNINFTFDEHGHPELGNVSKAHIFNILLQRKLKELEINIKSRPVELGYEIRCVKPIAFDLLYCSLLGYGVKKLFDQNVSGAMVTSDPKGDVKPLYLKDLTDHKGKIKPRLVNMSSQKSKMVFEDGLQFITEKDYKAVKEFFDLDPKEFDFKKILNW
ncbi:MAG: 6-phosphofructokinase [Bacteroidales bacterium]|nr:6-phosphofructokinase [Bacteroidales bacterium]MCF8343977.1 6-phosphofructokinase [Bacteroidales bacterium]MCF8351108.1 6-phosphofructokinase [Bacteroidales bacterium]MCF8376959.1 6-phosphofructokinase [Bacteroidales bacterium]MCF8401301.1 6-phosphofructokinase [Bacteroidales bacterium]